jgi:hypothetical protein
VKRYAFHNKTLIGGNGQTRDGHLQGMEWLGLEQALNTILKINPIVLKN